MASYNLNEILKQRAALKKQDENKEMDLGDTARVKVLSPMRQVMKRFLRNRLAIFGSVTLIIMFAFAFLGPLFYPYGEDETQYKYDMMVSSYAFVQKRIEYTGFNLNPEVKYNRNVVAKTNSNINVMEAAGQQEMRTFGADGMVYDLEKLGDNIYLLSQYSAEKVAAFGTVREPIGVYKSLGRTLDFENEDLGEEFVAAAAASCKGKNGSFEFGDATYEFEPGKEKKTYNIYRVAEESFQYESAALGEAFEALAQAEDAETFEFNGHSYLNVPGAESTEVYEMGEKTPFLVYSTLSFDSYVTSLPLTDSFKTNALLAAYGEGSFEAEAILNTDAFQAEAAARAIAAQQPTHVDVDPAAEGEAPETEAPEETEGDEQVEEGAVYVNAKFTIAPSEEREGVFVVSTEDGKPYAELNTMVVRRYNGDDTMDLDLKHALRDTVTEMMTTKTQSATMQFSIPEQDEKGRSVYDEEGQLQYAESTMTVRRQSGQEGDNYIVDASQRRHLIDKFAAPTKEHVMGTDGDGFDVLARIMYGGRISLMVGFVVVFIECFLGIIMGGLAGFFGGWVDTVVMRLVDIFYCLPFMPIMIIVGAMMDASRMNVRLRLFILMAAMGIMGWAYIARLVRGQILSLREQEFMTAAEATGLPVSRRIFRHLVPNVMPQLIVSATMGLGSTILSESTLSFLGLGVKHPMATWGSMINSVSSAAAMEHYAYIWIPVGLLICFTVIAFNFVGDGLRDAFDPKAKR